MSAQAWAPEALERVQRGAVVADVDLDAFGPRPSGLSGIEWALDDLQSVLSAIGNPTPFDLHAVFELGSAAEPIRSVDASRVRELAAASTAVPRIYLLNQAALAATFDASYYEVVLVPIRGALFPAERVRARLASIRFDPSEDYTWWIELRPGDKSA